MKKLIFFLISLLTVTHLSVADEGMYLLNDLPLKEMRKAGLRMRVSLDKETGYPEIAAGIVNLNGSSSSFISSEGLLLTNHHVAFSGIQQVSTLEDNILENGFLAQSRNEERHIPNFKAAITISFEDISDEILHALSDEMDPVARYDSVEYRIKRVIAREEKVNEKILVHSFYHGKSYYLIRRLEFKDVRLVYTPPRALGEFGGNIDNWMWPRHTADFTLLRVYADSLNNPAEFDPQNVPYHPKKYLTLSAKGLQPGDFTMVLGYPGRTQRYLTAREAAFTLTVEYPAEIQHDTFLIGLMDSLSVNDPEKALKFASRIKGLNNYKKKYEGMLDGLKKKDIIAEKIALEKELLENSPLHMKIDQILQQLDSLQTEYEASYFYRKRFNTLQQDPRLVSNASTICRWNNEKQKPDLERSRGYQARDYDALKQRLMYSMASYEEMLDKLLLNHHLLASLQAPENERFPFLDSLFSDIPNEWLPQAVSAFVDSLYKNSKLADPEYQVSLLNLPADAFNSLQDPLISFGLMLETQAEKFRQEDKKRAGEKMVLMPRYFDALIRSSNKPLYPDANGTLRYTYGHIKGYSPADAIWYNPFTTLTGLYEKDQGKYPFYVPDALK
ncbi:MAG: S46 family peptidase, partial [Candidatus Marinimicrobia bacterium]|nr:S46 family peptidase [Candidatus Neomarinimicrobiota bacterium]